MGDDPVAPGGLLNLPIYLSTPAGALKKLIPDVIDSPAGRILRDFYVFEDREEIQRIDYRTAYENGYLSLWFSENPSKIRVDQEHISWLDSNGAVIRQIETPDMIAKTIPPTKTEVLHKFLIGVLVVLYLPVCALIRYVHNRINAKIERKNKKARGK